jgi:hypothetical protein
MILQDKTSVSDHDEVRPDTGVGSKTQDKTSVSSRPDTGVIKTGHQCLIEPLLEPKERGARQARPRGPLSGEGGNPPPTTMTESMITRALQRAGWDTVKARNEFEKFRNRALSKGTASLNWDAEFYNWIERGVEHQARRKGQAGKIIDQEGNDVAPPPQAKPRPRKQSNTERARGLLQ